MKEQLTKEILKYHPNFNEAELAKGLTLFKLQHVAAKSIVLKHGNVADQLFFCQSSISRCYYLDKEGIEQTLWMKPELTFITEYKSFVNQAPSGFSLQFYEDTEVLSISRENLLKLYRESADWAFFGVQLMEALHVTLIDVFVNLLANDATRNYEYIEYMFPRFLQVAPLKDVASMLQMSAVSISRIRAGKQTKKITS